MGGDSMKRTDNRSSTSTNSRQSKKKRSGVVDFTDSLTRTVAAQLCEDAGFQGFHLSALSALSDVVVRYIHEIGRNASSYANSANRSECNSFDVIQGLEDLGTAQGFSGAADVHRCVSSSGVIRDLEQYVEEAKEIQFAYSVPKFPVVKKREPLRPSFAQAGMKPPVEHIPSWLPVFPDPEAGGSVHLGGEKVVQNGEAELVEKDKEILQQKITCVASESSDVSKEKSSLESNPIMAAIVQNGDGKVEGMLIGKEAYGVRPLANLQQKMTVSEPSGAVNFGDEANQKRSGNPFLAPPVHNKEGKGVLVQKDAEGVRPLGNLQQKMTVSEPSFAVNYRDAANRKRSLACNPFLAPPIQLGEKEGISPVVIPHKRWDEAFLHANDRGVFHKHVSGLDTSAPAIKGLNNGSKIDPGEDGNKDAIPFDRSSTVKLRFFDVKKSLHRGVNLQKHEDLKTIPWFANDDSEDEKKTRAEPIPKESLESVGAGSIVN